MDAASWSVPAGKRTRCLKRCIFKKKGAGQPERADLRNRTGRHKNQKNFASSLPQQFAKSLRAETLRGRAVLLNLDGDVFDGRQRAQDMDFLVRCVDVNLQSSVMRANANMLLMIHDFHEVSVREPF